MEFLYALWSQEYAAGKKGAKYNSKQNLPWSKWALNLLDYK